ncbi:MAG TPA: bifunctional riboflavin kinase/FAD synthetase [Synechococcales cyanobacterium M55_K2018_004]|nr:bifunctional riboflavin kinase/FAD synthetase [Synechococcales cyanobacterium M55_K2018_004]
MWITSSLNSVKTPTRIALGNFDGVHRGHQRVIEPVLASAAPLDDVPGLATVVTFSPHPREFFTGQRRDLLTPLEEKARYLRAMGVEQLVLLPFDRALATLTAEEFVEQILIEKLQARFISVGLDFHFGRQRQGTSADLQAIATQHNAIVHVVPLYRTENGDRISSSAIRQALLEGDVLRANTLLGRPYSLIGTVVQGQQLGRTLGFPTANLKLPPEKFLPCCGVYCAWVRIAEGSEPDDDEARSHPHDIPAVMNLGMRPTVDGLAQTCEIHLLDWQGDLYGKTLTVNLEKFLRPEQKFPSLAALKAQIQQDCELARSLLAVSQSR